MIRLSSSGSFNGIKNYAKRASKTKTFNLQPYGEAGVAALAAATPVDSQLTANSWHYRIVQMPRGPRLEWYNTNSVDGVTVAIILQHGHGTGNGGYVAGMDYINPAIQPVFDAILQDIRKLVK